MNYPDSLYYVQPIAIKTCLFFLIKLYFIILWFGTWGYSPGGSSPRPPKTTSLIAEGSRLNMSFMLVQEKWKKIQIVQGCKLKKCSISMYLVVFSFLPL